MHTSAEASSSYYGYYGFRDWTVTDDERLFGILSGYRYTHGSSAPVNYHRAMEMDISRDDTWTCIDSYDISPSVGEYTGIAYDRQTDQVWVAHNAMNRLYAYDFAGDGTGTYTRGQDFYTYTSATGSSWECGGSYGSGSTNASRTGGQRFDLLHALSRGLTLQRPRPTRGLVRIRKFIGSHPESTTRQLSRLGYGLQFDGERFRTVDCGYSTWSGATLYY